MYQLIYASSASYLFTDEELLALLAQCRNKNASLDVTGLLLYKDGNFLQALEGEESTVHSLYDKISLDRRHKGHLVLLKGQVKERDFADWSMGFRNLDLKEVGDLPGYNQLLNGPFDPRAFAGEPSRARKLLQTFQRIM